MASREIRNFIKLALVAPLLTTIACGQASFSGGSAASKVSTPDSPVIVDPGSTTTTTTTTTTAGPTTTTVPACEIDIPQLLISGNVNSFEFSGSFGVTAGYNQNGAHAGVGGSASVKVSNSTMDLTMLASDPLSNVALASTEADPKQTNTDINGTVDFSNFSLGASAFLTSPLAAVTKKGLTLAVSDLDSKINSALHMQWVGHVISVPSSNVVIMNAGSLAGVQVGDKFEVHNVDHYWTGEACKSQYLGSVAEPKALAVLTVTSLSSATAFGTLSNVDSAQSMRLGAELWVKSLVGDPARILKKKVKLGTLKANSFTVPGGIQFDFGSAINGQIPDVILNSNFVND